MVHYKNRSLALPVNGIPFVSLVADVLEISEPLKTQLLVQCGTLVVWQRDTWINISKAMVL